jgi:hypothetical protein
MKIEKAAETPLLPLGTGSKPLPALASAVSGRPAIGASGGVSVKGKDITESDAKFEYLENYEIDKLQKIDGGK